MAVTSPSASSVAVSAPQLEGGAVALAVEGEQPQELGGLAYAHHEHSRGGGVERAGVAHAPLPHRAADAGDDVVARHAGRLVYGDERGEGARSAGQRQPSAGLAPAGPDRGAVPLSGA